MYNMMKSGKGRFFLTSIVRNYFPSVTYRRLLCTIPYRGDLRDSNGRPFPRLVEVDLFDRPLPPEDVLSLIKDMKRLTKEEKHEYRFIFSEALGLATPPKTPRGADERFLVKLIKFEESKFHDVLREVAWAKTTEVDKTVLYQFYMSESYEILFEVPSIVKEYV